MAKKRTNQLKSSRFVIYVISDEFNVDLDLAFRMPIKLIVPFIIFLLTKLLMRIVRSKFYRYCCNTK